LTSRNRANLSTYLSSIVPGPFCKSSFLPSPRPPPRPRLAQDEGWVSRRSIVFTLGWRGTTTPTWYQLHYLLLTSTLLSPRLGRDSAFSFFTTQSGSFEGYCECPSDSSLRCIIRDEQYLRISDFCCRDTSRRVDSARAPRNVEKRPCVEEGG
jgi:hypothetical protein